MSNLEDLKMILGSADYETWIKTLEAAEETDEELQLMAVSDFHA